MPKTVTTDWASKGSFAGVLKRFEYSFNIPGDDIFLEEIFLISHLQHVVLKVQPSFECLVTVRAWEGPDIVVDGVDVRGEPALLREVLSAQLAPDLPTDAVGPEVVAQGVAVRVTLLANVAHQLLRLKSA